MIAALVMLTWLSARASDNDYFYDRKWIELNSVTNTTPKEERLFVGRSHSPKYAEIVQYRKGITLRELIDRSPLKGKVVQVCVMWPHTIPKTGSTFTRHEYITVGPTDNPTYQLKNLDVVWFYDEGPILIR